MANWNAQQTTDAYVLSSGLRSGAREQGQYGALPLPQMVAQTESPEPCSTNSDKSLASTVQLSPGSRVFDDLAVGKAEITTVGEEGPGGPAPRDTAGGLYGGQKCEGMLYERGGSDETAALDRGQHAGPSSPGASEGPDMMSQSPAPLTEPRSLVPETLAGIGLNSQFGNINLPGMACGGGAPTSTAFGNMMVALPGLPGPAPSHRGVPSAAFVDPPTSRDHGGAPAAGGQRQQVPASFHMPGFYMPPLPAGNTTSAGLWGGRRERRPRRSRRR